VVLAKVELQRTIKGRARDLVAGNGVADLWAAYVKAFQSQCAHDFTETHLAPSFIWGSKNEMIS